MARQFIAVLLLTMVGCGPRVGTISGEVTFQGKPVPGGLLTFRHEDDSVNSVSYELQPDGKYHIDIEVGKVMVCIDNREFEPRAATMPAMPPGMNLPADVVKSMQASTKEASKVSDRWVKLPEKYYQIETSDVQIDVRGGKQTANIEFKE